MHEYAHFMQNARRALPHDAPPAARPAPLARSHAPSPVMSGVMSTRLENSTDATRGQPLWMRVLARKDELEDALAELGPHDAVERSRSRPRSRRCICLMTVTSRTRRRSSHAISTAGSSATSTSRRRSRAASKRHGWPRRSRRPRRRRSARRRTAFFRSNSQRLSIWSPRMTARWLAWYSLSLLLVACGSARDRPGGGGDGSNGTDAANQLGTSCSSDLHDVLDDNGNVVATCPDDQGCAAGACVPACQAAAASQGSVGCDFVVATPSFYVPIAPPCFAVFLANNWPKDAVVTVTARRSDVRPEHVRPRAQRLARRDDLVDHSGDRHREQQCRRAVPRPGSGSNNVGNTTACSVTTALGRRTAPRCTPARASATGIGTAFHITTSFPVSAYDILPYGGASTYSAERRAAAADDARGAPTTSPRAPTPTSGPGWGQIVAATGRHHRPDHRRRSRCPVEPALLRRRAMTTTTLHAATRASTSSGKTPATWPARVITSNKPVSFTGGTGYLCLGSQTSSGGGCDSGHQHDRRRYPRSASSTSRRPMRRAARTCRRSRSSTASSARPPARRSHTRRRSPAHPRCSTSVRSSSSRRSVRSRSRARMRCTRSTSASTWRAARSAAVSRPARQCALGLPRRRGVRQHHCRPRSGCRATCSSPIRPTRRRTSSITRKLTNGMFQDVMVDCLGVVATGSRSGPPASTRSRTSISSVIRPSATAPMADTPHRAAARSTSWSGAWRTRPPTPIPQAATSARSTRRRHRQAAASTRARVVSIADGRSRRFPRDARRAARAAQRRCVGRRGARLHARALEQVARPDDRAVPRHARVLAGGAGQVDRGRARRARGDASRRQRRGRECAGLRARARWRAAGGVAVRALFARRAGVRALPQQPSRAVVLVRRWPVGAGSRAPRPDEGPREQWDELDVALGWLEQLADRGEPVPARGGARAACSANAARCGCAATAASSCPRSGCPSGPGCSRRSRRCSVRSSRASWSRISRAARRLARRAPRPVRAAGALHRDLRIVLGDLDEHGVGVPAELRAELEAWRTPPIACRLGEATLELRQALG